MSANTLIQHANIITSKLYNYKKVGFVNKTVLESNEIYSIFRNLYPKQKDIFNKTSVQVMFELEHFHNFILLLLVLEIDIQLEKLLQVWDKKDVDVTMTISDLKAMRFRVL